MFLKTEYCFVRMKIALCCLWRPESHVIALSMFYVDIFMILHFLKWSRILTQNDCVHYVRGNIYFILCYCIFDSTLVSCV